MIKISELNKTFRLNPIFSNYHIDLSPQKICLQAGNGLGKTTLFSIIAGVDPHFKGNILYDGKPSKAPQNQVAFASDRIIFPAFLTSKQVLQMSVKSWHCDFPLRWINAFNFSEFLETNVSQLSSGNIKKLQLINAFMRNTPYMILDEPTAALDSQGIQTVLDFMDEYKGQLIISCHEPDIFLSAGFTAIPLFDK